MVWMHAWSRRHTHSKLAQNIPVADAKPDDIKDLLGGALFQALYKWMTESGPVYLLVMHEPRGRRGISGMRQQIGVTILHSGGVKMCRKSNLFLLVLCRWMGNA